MHFAELLPFLQLLPEGEEGGGRRPGARPDVLAGEGARGALPGASCTVGWGQVLRVVETGRAGGQGAAGGARARGLAVERRQRFLQEGKGRGLRGDTSEARMGRGSEASEVALAAGNFLLGNTSTLRHSIRHYVLN